MTRAGYAPDGATLHEQLDLGVEQGAPDECWLWTKAVDRDGYGQIARRVNGKVVKHKAHVVAFERAAGRPAVGHVLHHCDTPPCCNPTCLYDGTASDNAQDRITSGRVRCQAVLTPADVLAMRARYADRRPTLAEQRQLAAIHGVSVKTIENAITYRTWRNLNPGEGT